MLPLISWFIISFSRRISDRGNEAAAEIPCTIPVLAA
jgi:hypothetical protein